MEPKSRHIISVREQIDAENNAVAKESLECTPATYPKLNSLVLDRAFAFMPSALKTPSLVQIKNFVIDKFHAQGHSDKCPCNPYVHQRLMRLLKGINTPACEQLFSWFRNYARSFNELRADRHRFITLYFAKKHNDLVDASDTAHLSRHSLVRKKKRSRRPYKCTPMKKRKEATGRLTRAIANKRKGCGVGKSAGMKKIAAKRAKKTQKRAKKTQSA